MLAIPFPAISPEIFTIEAFGGQFSLRWYALAYILGLVLAWRMVARLMRRPALWPGGTAPMKPERAEDLLTWMVFGVIVGGRLGFVLFYQPGYYAQNPGEIVQIWNGGMSFHGGMLGVVLGLVLFARLNRLPLLQVADAVACATPVGLLLGRLANFINAELWGRPTDMPWGVIFPGEAAQTCPGVAGLCARHPSQLYEAALEGLALFLLLYWLARSRMWLKTPGAITGMFLIGYGAARSFVELFRQADPQFATADNPLGHALRFGTGPEAAGLTMGQALSLPMILLGLWLVLRARRARVSTA